MQNRRKKNSSGFGPSKAYRNMKVGRTYFISSRNNSFVGVYNGMHYEGPTIDKRPIYTFDTEHGVEECTDDFLSFCQVQTNEDNRNASAEQRNAVRESRCEQIE